MSQLTNQEITRVVNQYIGVSSGYLGDFSYRTHADFYPEYCDLDIDPNQIEGTTRERFISILKSRSPTDQAKILRGVLQRFPVEATYKPETRTPSLRDEILHMIQRLEWNTAIPIPVLQNTSETVKRAITDAELLLSQNGAVSGIDRLHTALHGYLRAICSDAGISFAPDDPIARLLKLIRKQHPAFQNLGSRGQDIERVYQSFGAVLDAVNSIRNNASLAHANENLLEVDEAYLVINAVNTILHYLEAKLRK
jgi:hypothetical protein